MRACIVTEMQPRSQKGQPYKRRPRDGRSPPNLLGLASGQYYSTSR